jgi:hypothetical protein
MSARRATDSGTVAPSDSIGSSVPSAVVYSSF